MHKVCKQFKLILTLYRDGSIEFLDGGDIKWTAAIKEGVVLAVGNTNFVAVAGKSNTLHLFSYSGRRVSFIISHSTNVIVV